MRVEDITEAHIRLQLFPGYSEEDTQILKEFANPDPVPTAGFITDFLGSRIRTTSVWKESHTLDGSNLGLPDPCDFHAEAIEWIGTLKAVREAQGKYVSLELGAGYGPWTVAGALAAQRRGIADIRLHAVEGDSHHFQFLRQHLVDNGFNPDRHFLYEAAVGVKDGEVEWPIDEIGSPADSYGRRPLEDGKDYEGLVFARTKKVPLISFTNLLLREPDWNLVHIDLQGHEFDICRSAVDILSQRVQRLVIGTHSRKLDGDLVQLLFSAGWLLEHEKPAQFRFRSNVPTLEAMTVIDGTQVWRNPRLLSFQQGLSCDTQSLTMKAGATQTLSVRVQNTGDQQWRGQNSGSQEAYPVNLGFRWLDASRNPLPLEGRAILNGPFLLPQAVDQLELSVAAPAARGSYVLLVSMVQDGVAWFHDRGGQALLLPTVVI